ncbi:MAG: FHA domain-containing protein [Chloroflexota bacterium]|nr:FHA domain-containing protein [Chloroflexota bacterium]
MSDNIPKDSPSSAAPPAEPKIVPTVEPTIEPKVQELRLGIACPKCGHLNRAGALKCEVCGTVLDGDTSGLGTKQFDKATRDAALGSTDTSELVSAIDSAGSSVFTEDMVLRLEIEGATTPILLFPKKETVIGRRDPGTSSMPDVDLTTYAGYRMGVSRRHAIIRLRNSEIEIFDLGSSNGTAVNGGKLQPHQPHPLKDGDELSLGKMTLRVLFQLRTRRRSLT